MPTMYFIINLIVLLLILHAGLELRQRDRHLKWVEMQHEQFADLWGAAMNLTLIPKDNPISQFKVGGILTSNALRPEVVSMLDERLDSLGGALKAVARSAKALATWEKSHEAPPLHYWQAWKRAWDHRKDKPPPPPHETKTEWFKGPIYEPRELNR